MLAALTGAVTASRLGIAGTIIGAAFMSLASTVGSAIYKHYLTRSNERLRAAAASLAPKASHSAVASAVARHHAQQDPIQPGRPGRAGLVGSGLVGSGCTGSGCTGSGCAGSGCAGSDPAVSGPSARRAPGAGAWLRVPRRDRDPDHAGAVPGRRPRLGPDPDVRLGPARPRPAGPGPAQPGPARPGPARPGPARPFRHGPQHRPRRSGRPGRRSPNRPPARAG